MKIKTNWKIVLGVCICALFLKTTVQAEEYQIKKNTLVKTTVDTMIYKTPEANSEQIMMLMAGTELITSEDMTGDWILVKRGDTEGYIESNKITLYQAAGIENEFENKSNTLDLLFSEIEYIGREKKQKLIWGMVIAVLVIAIFLLGIIQNVRKIKEQKKEKNH